MRYEDALQQVLEALHTGESLDAALARFPEYAGTLLDDVRIDLGGEDERPSPAGLPALLVADPQWRHLYTGAA